MPARPRHRHHETPADSRGCKQISDCAERQEGSDQKAPPEHLPEGSVYLTFEGTRYTLRFPGWLIEIPGSAVSTFTTRCPGVPDTEKQTTTELSILAGLEAVEPITRDLNPQNPGHLTGTATFADPLRPWITITLNWDLKRP